MYNHYASTARGLSIVVLVLAILGLAFNLAMLAFLSFGLDAAEFDELVEYVTQELTSSQSLAQSLEEAGIDGANITSFAYAAIYATFAFFGIVALCCLVSLIASILGITRAKEPGRLGGAFALMIVSAVLGFLTGRYLTMVLSIVAAVYASKAKKLAASAAEGDMPGAGFGGQQQWQQYGTGQQAPYYPMPQDRQHTQPHKQPNYQQVPYGQPSYGYRPPKEK